MRILVAEDEERLRTIIRDYFTAHGLTCALAKDGEEALDVALYRRSTDAQGRILPDSGYPDGDLGRTAAQRALLAAVMEQALSLFAAFLGE